MGNVGSRIYSSLLRLDNSILEGFRGVASPNLGDVMGRSYVMNHLIKPLNHSDVHLVGQALDTKGVVRVD
jgi:hypothetical protein